MNLQSKKIYFDLDGTLIDSKKRQFLLFLELIGDNLFNYEQYWNVKRNNISQKDLLKKYFNYKNVDIIKFKDSWNKKIEEINRLNIDEPFPGITELLEKLSYKKELFILTARQYPDRVHDQLDRFGWLHYFKEILVTSQRVSKASLVNKSNLNKFDILVGDSIDDIAAGKELGLKTVAVTTGILSNQILAKYKPDLIIDSLIKENWYK